MHELKKMLFAVTVVLVSFLAAAVSCEPEPEPEPEPGPDPASTCFDLYVCAVKHGGMGQNKNGTFVRRVTSLDAGQPTVEFTGRGLDITTRFTMESITKGKYYYQVPQEATGGFVKFHLALDAAGNEQAVVDRETPFRQNTYYARKYTHAWLDGGATLLVLGTDSDHKVICWSKINDTDFSIVGEGQLELPLPDGFSCFSTSGLLTLRPTDGRLFYIYYVKPLDETAKPVTHISVIDPGTMRVVSDTKVPEAVMEEPVTAAYGELLRNIIAYDESGTMYVAGLCTRDGVKLGVMRRLPAGKNVFDSSWNGFPDPEGRLLTIQYIADGEMLCYSRDERLGTKIDSRSHFYTIVDLGTTRRERVKCDGKELPYCSGGYSQRTAVVDGKAYFGITGGDGPDEMPQVFIYDAASHTVTAGVKLSKGFCFDIIRAMELE